MKHSQQNQDEMDSINLAVNSLKQQIAQFQQEKLKINIINNEEYEQLMDKQMKLNQDKNFLILCQQKQQVIQSLEQLFNIEVDESNLEQYKQEFLQTNFSQETNISNYEQIVKSEQIKLQQQIDVYQVRLEQIEKQKNQQSKKQQFFNLIVEQQQDIERLNNELNQKYGLETNDTQSFSPQEPEELQFIIEKKNKEKEELMNQLDISSKEIQQLRQSYKQNLLEGSTLNNQIRLEHIPQLDQELFNLEADISKDSKGLLMKTDQLQSYKENHQVKVNLQKLEQEIKNMEKSLQENKNKEIQFKTYKERLSQFCLQGKNEDQVIETIIQLENYQKFQNNQLNYHCLELIHVDIAQIQSKIKKFNLLDKKLASEQCIQKYQKEIDKIDEESKNEFEIIQGTEEIQEKICSKKDLQAQINQNKKNLETFKLILKLQEQLQNLNDQKIPLKKVSDQDISQIDEQLEIITLYISEYNEFQKLLQKLLFTQQVLHQQDSRYTQLKNDMNFSHNCGFDNHQCDQLCQVCNENNTSCKFRAGHNEQFHLCENQLHFCQKKCEKDDCDKLCQYQYGHEQNEQFLHNCLDNHQCQQKCNFCEDPCHFNDFFQHNDHQCQRVYCNQNCYFKENFFNESSKCENTCSRLHNEIHDQHICQNKHQCHLKCELRGVCQIGSYTEKQIQRETQNGSFQFTLFEQNAEQKQCQTHLERGQFSHGEQHLCGKSNHTCESRCPECNAFCEKEYQHQGQHSVSQHRNKEKQQFALLQENSDNGKSKIIIQFEQGQEERIYNVGENCQPETCTASCFRRGRAHFHLAPCPGPSTCLEKRNNYDNIYTKHQPKLYFGSQSLHDEILCNQFWEYQNWQHPVNKKLGQLISFCNYYCKKCEQDQKGKNFCMLKAWHKDSQNYADHKFSCEESHIFNGIDIAFVIDSTESMSKYLSIIQESVQKFQNASDKFNSDEKCSIMYSIISYTDHEKDYNKKNPTECVKFLDFTDFKEVLDFTKQIAFEKSSDDCEAMLDGLHKATQIKWRQKSQKFIFLLADAPPHGKPKFHNYSSLFFNTEDNFPEGCPCGLKEDIILKKIAEKQIKLIILKLNQELNLTISVFKKYINVLELYSTELKQEDYINQMEKLICEELKTNEITLTIKQ